VFAIITIPFNPVTESFKYFDSINHQVLYSILQNRQRPLYFAVKRNNHRQRRRSLVIPNRDFLRAIDAIRG